MTAPDGGAQGFDAPGACLLPNPHAILLHGGRALLMFEDAKTAPPRSGELLQTGAALPWTAECWQIGEVDDARWCGLAVLDALPAPHAELRAAGDARRWRFGAAPTVDIAPQPLADLVRRAGVDQRAVFDFLLRHLIAGRPADTAEALAHHAFARGFFIAAAERDGFIELLAQPECGGVFAQGWSRSLSAGAATLASVAGDLAVLEVAVAHVERDDILPPGRGVCLFGPAWRMPDALDAVFFEKDGRLLRLDVARTATYLKGPEASEHVAQMLPSLQGPDETLRRFKRVCRPRFAGLDTLSDAQAPIAVGLDAVLQAPDGGLLLTGWLLDPLRLLRLALVKSDARLYAPIQGSWVRFSRPGVSETLASDPRFAGLLGTLDTLAGFIVHVPAERERSEHAQVYLELVLDDESCLFRPLNVAPMRSGERLPQALAALSPKEPELARIVDDHLAPFLASVPAAPAAAPQDAPRPIPLGGTGPARDVVAIMPLRSLAELQPVLAMLAGTPEADALDLVLVAARAVAAEMLKPLGEAFRFYGLRGALVIASDRDTSARRLDAGVAAAQGARVLVWMPAGLPKAPGWLARLIAEADGLPAPGLLSPTMTYEDGAVYFGAAEDGAPVAGPAGAAGNGAAWLRNAAPAPTPAGAAEVALIDRALLARAGGFAGRQFSDAYAGADLADRLRLIGAGTWRSGAVAFWMLEGPQPADADPFAALMQQVDASLRARRRRDAEGDPTP